MNCILFLGPLGSMVGIFELLIEELCTDRRTSQTIKPKIISSTATIKRYREQIKALYARDEACLFPPPGGGGDFDILQNMPLIRVGCWSAGEFSLGSMPPELGSMQTVQVRTSTALLQSPLELQDTERDPWWTLVMFFNN